MNPKLETRPAEWVLLTEVRELETVLTGTFGLRLPDRPEVHAVFKRALTHAVNA